MPPPLKLVQYQEPKIVTNVQPFSTKSKLIQLVYSIYINSQKI